MISSYFTADQPEFEELYILQKSDAEKAAEIFAKAFMYNPITAYTIPDEKKRKEKVHYMFEYLLRYGINYGLAMSPSSELEGIAVWLCTPYTNETILRQIRSGVLKVIWKLGVNFVKNQLKLRSAIEHVTHESTKNLEDGFIYLYSFCVEPAFQGRGYASALLKQMIAFSERTQVPIYLETAPKDNRIMYKHFDFQIKAQKAVPDSEYIMYGMVREP
ncbi:MAG: GNAT family N-acetyltransferase [Promethearchaeia archaeon]